MKMVLMIALLLFGSFSANVAGAPRSPAKLTLQENNKEAERLWELAIAAKGGRERLHTVNNLQVSIREKVWYGLRRLPFIWEALYVFPNKSWEWHDERKTIFGFSIVTYNQERNIFYWYVDHGKGGALAKPMDLMNGKAGLSTLYHMQLRYFMETKWVKPIPMSVETGKVGRHSVDIIQTIVKGFPTKDGKDETRIGFALDRKTHLPRQVIYYTISFGKEYSGGVDLSDYTEINGLQIPLKVDGLKSNCQINVDFNEQIFEQQPNVAAGIEAWKRKQ